MPLPSRHGYIRNRQTAAAAGNWTVYIPRPAEAIEGDWIIALLCIGSAGTPLVSASGWTTILTQVVNTRAIAVFARRYDEDDPSTYPIVYNANAASVAAEVSCFAISDATDVSNWVIGSSWRRTDNGGSQATTRSPSITVPNESLVLALEIEATNAVENDGSEVISGATKWFGSPNQTTASVAIERVLVSYIDVPLATTTPIVTTTWPNAALNAIGLQIGIPYLQAAPDPSEYAKDTFERIVGAGGWGTADVGGAWTHGANASSASVSAGKANISLTAPSSSAYGKLSAVSHLDVEMYVEWSVDKIPIGSNVRPRFISRSISSVGDYHVRGTVMPNGTVDYRWYRDDTAGLGSTVTLPRTYVVNDILKVRIQTFPNGSGGTRLRARMWYADEPEPTAWGLDLVDSTAGYQVAGSISLHVGLGSAVSNGPIVTHFDNLIVTAREPDATSATGNIGLHVVPQFSQTSLRVGAKFLENSLTNQVRIYTGSNTQIDAKTPVIETSKWGHVDFTGLTPDTEYTIKFFVNSVEQTDAVFTVRTLPFEKSAFVVVAGSCQFTGSSHPIFTKMKEDNPLFIAHMGDLHYQDSSDETAWRNAVESSLNSVTMKPLLQSTPFSWTWDNHDRIIVDTLNLGSTSPLNVPAWRELAGATGWSSPTTMGRTWTAGRVRFIQTDQWSVRDDPDLVSEPRTFLGSAQKQWWKDTLLASKEAVIIWFCQWTAQNHSNGRWNSFNAETTELENWLNANPSVKERLVLIGGDSHQLQADSGTRTRAQGSRFNGVPSLNVSGFNRSATGASSGNWDIAEGDIRLATESESAWGAYSRLTFTDDGLTINMLWEAVQVNPTGGTAILASWNRKTGTAIIDGNPVIAQYYRVDESRIQPLSVEIPE